MSFLPRPCAATASSCVPSLGMLPTTATRIGECPALGGSSLFGQRDPLSSLHVEKDYELFLSFVAKSGKSYFYIFACCAFASDPLVSCAAA